MNYVQNLLWLPTITTIVLFVFVGSSHPPHLAQAAQEENEQFSCTDVTEIPQLECEALVALYNGAGGPNWSYDPEWGNGADWLATNTPCDWYGITCDEGNIIELYLRTWSSYKFGLQGDLPAEIGNLSRLTYLNLSTNRLTNLPAEIGNLSNLTELSLAENYLTNLPAEIGNLNNLTELNLYWNRLNSIPPSIGNLNQLTDLELEYNQLRSVPVEIWNLNNLTYLSLSYNQLSCLPAEIGNLNNLTRLDLYHNRLRSLPDEIGNLNNLVTLQLYFNQLSSLPSSITNLNNLTALHLGLNPLVILDDDLRSFVASIGNYWPPSPTIVIPVADDESFCYSFFLPLIDN